jgi:hypothetical protein
MFPILRLKVNKYSIKQENLINDKYPFELFLIWMAFTPATLVTTCNFPITSTGPIDSRSNTPFQELWWGRFEILPIVNSIKAVTSRIPAIMKFVGNDNF